MVDERQLFVALFLGDLDALLDIANRVEILRELRAIGLRKRALHPGDLLPDGVQDAPLLPDAGETHVRIGASAVAEQPFEDDARVVLRRQRRVLTLPRNRVGVGARKPGIARAGGFTRLDRELERRKLRPLAGLVRQNLI